MIQLSIVDKCVKRCRLSLFTLPKLMYSTAVSRRKRRNYRRLSNWRNLELKCKNNWLYRDVGIHLVVNEIIPFKYLKIFVDKWIQAGKIREGSSVQLSICRAKKNELSIKRRQLKERLEEEKDTREDGRSFVIRIERADARSNREVVTCAFHNGETYRTDCSWRKRSRMRQDGLAGTRFSVDRFVYRQWIASV